MHNGKAAGMCAIPPELLKYQGFVMVGVLTGTFNVLLQEQRVPAEWKRAIVVPLLSRKGVNLDCGNFRGISLLPVPRKLFILVLLKKIKPHIGLKLRQEQSGFPTGRSTGVKRFALKQAVEKRLEYSLPT